jgi:hypothetical protein
VPNALVAKNLEVVFNCSQSVNLGERFDNDEESKEPSQKPVAAKAKEIAT